MDPDFWSLSGIGGWGWPMAGNPCNAARNDRFSQTPGYALQSDSLAEQDGFELAVPARRKGYGELLLTSIAVSA